ncbi:MAG: hypothetical protein MRY32_07745 [Rickettsiales bacterium]|nr:hypothetical protein [Rickettsiales bacterium]
MNYSVQHTIDQSIHNIDQGLLMLKRSILQLDHDSALVIFEQIRSISNSLKQIEMSSHTIHELSINHNQK